MEKMSGNEEGKKSESHEKTYKEHQPFWGMFVSKGALFMIHDTGKLF